MNKHQKRVLRDFPKARVSYAEDGGYVIMNGDECITDEYFLPAGINEAQAWEYASLTCRMTQNFNRTHPLRDTGESIEDRILRFERRKSNTNDKTNKTIV
jgi:hypothetical protein